MFNPRKRQRGDDGDDSDSTTVLSEKEDIGRRARKMLRISAPPSSRASSVTAVTSPIAKKCAQLVFKDDYFTLPKDCTEETEHLVLPEESGTPFELDPDSIPVRILRDFIIYDELQQNRLVALDDIYESGTSVRAYGLVAAMTTEEGDEEEPDPDDDDDEDASANPYEGEKTYELSLGAVWSYYIEPNPTEPMILIKTQWAWYILDRPDDRYLPLYVDHWADLYKARLVLARTPALKQFYELEDYSVTQEEVGGPVSLFSTSFTDEDISGPNVCTEDMVEQLGKEVDGPANNALWRAFRQLSSRKSRTLKDAKGFTRKKSAVSQNRQARGRPPANIERDVLKHRNPTYATEFVRNLASNLCFRFYGESIKQEDDSMGAKEDLTCDPKTVLDDAFTFSSEASTDADWYLSDRRDEEEIDEEDVESYLSAQCDSYSLKAGDFVVVRGDPKDDRKTWNIKGSGAVSNKWVHWFAQVVFFYKEKNGRTCHAHLRWLEHSSRTQLGESGHPRELFLLTTCNSVALTTIISKINVRYISPGELEPHGYPYRAVDKDHFFYRYATNEHGDILCASQSMFPIEMQTFDTISLFGCFTCHLRKSTMLEDTPSIPGGRDNLLSYGGVTYHLFDFAYIAPDQSTEVDLPFRIGQIVQIRKTGANPTIVVRLFERYDDVTFNVKNEQYKDHKRLVDSQRKRIVNPTKLRGKCFVMHKDTIRQFDEWVMQDDHFFADCMKPDSRASGPTVPSSLMSLPVSNIRYCEDRECNMKRTAAHSPEPRRKLRGLDLYHGAGGLSFGLEKSGAIETCWGIDFSPSAHLTFKKNFPGATAILQCANEVLRHAIESENGRRLEPLNPINGDDYPCPALPKPGDVDIVVCGPPCQGYSVLNSHRRTDDIKNTLVANALSYVDHLRPRFFMLENVQPLLTSRGKVLTLGDIEERIVENAVRKFIVRFLTARGYQVRVTVLQAGKFGAAQHRARVFFWAARRGESLPEFPLPTHTWTTAKTKTRDERGGAPLPQVGVRDVIGDLKEWHWINPKQLLPHPIVPAPTGPTFDAVTYDRKTQACGYTSFVPYGKQAMTPYQKDLRQDCKGVRYHATLTYVSESVERVCNVPPPDEKRGVDGGLDYRYIGPSLQQWHLTSPHSRAAKGGFGEGKYARVYPNLPARTVLTRNEPTGKQGRVLHYEQYRVLSAQENARLQGFPDSFTFISQGDDFRDIMRLIGNAVPIPLGYHLGLQLAKSVMAKESEQLASDSAVKEEGPLSPDL